MIELSSCACLFKALFCVLHGVAASTELLVNRNVNPYVVLYYIELFCNVIIPIDTRQNAFLLFIRGLQVNTCLVVRHLSPEDEVVYTNGTSNGGAKPQTGSNLNSEPGKRPYQLLKVTCVVYR